MYKVIEVGNIAVPMEANAATPIRYRMLFKKDLLTQFQAAQDDAAKVSDTIPELGFIMAMQAAKANLSAVSFDDYLEWLEQFGPLDLLNAGGEIANLYTDNTATASEPKKKADQPNGK